MIKTDSCSFHVLSGESYVSEILQQKPNYSSPDVEESEYSLIICNDISA